MAYLSIDPSDNSLTVYNCFDQKGVVADIGGKWDAVSKIWRVAFTISNLEYLVDKLHDLSVSPLVEQKALEQQKREETLASIREMSKKDLPVKLKVSGLKLGLYNYQKYGVMFGMENGTGILLADEMGLGKGQVVDAEVFTTTGRVRIGSLKVGDYVIGKDGKPTKVTGVFPKPVQDVFRVTFNDGFHLDVDSDHLWYVRSNNQHNTERETQGVVLSIRQLLDKDGIVERRGIGHNKDKAYRFKTYYKKANGNNSWSIPVVDSIQFESKDVSIDPYLLGVFLGDGHILKGGQVSIAMLKSDIEEMLGEHRDKERRYKTQSPHLTTYYFRDREFRDKLISLGLAGKRAWEKFIPKEYIYNSMEVRLAILRGLMDTDGNASDYATEYSTTSKQLCDDVVEIVQTLGGIARVRTKVPTYKGVKKRGRLAYRVNIKLPASMNPFSLGRKARDYDVNSKYPPERYICKIEKQKERRETVCISVDAKDHLYVSEHCVVTHNTLQSIAIALFLKSKGKANNALIIVPASLKYNWPLEIEKFTNEKYVVIDGTPEERVVQWLRNDVFFYVVNYELLQEDLFGGRKFKEIEEIVGETIEQREKREKQNERKAKQQQKAEMRQRILAEVRNRMWDFICIDEGQAIKHHEAARSRNTKSLRGKFKIALTGTPMDGRLEELHSIMGFVAPGLLSSKTRFFQRYVEQDIWGKVTGYKRLAEVSKRIEPYFLRRLKKEVLPDLPDKIYQNRIVAMTPQEKDIYDSLADKGHEATIDTAAMVAVIRCKQFCNFPQMVDSNCMTTSKMDAFKEVVDEVVLQNGHKILIFSQYKEMLNIIEEQIRTMGLKFMRIDGDTPKKERADMQRLFNEDKSIDAMIGTEAMSTGLNFTAADYVLNYDDNWSPSIMAQREDRCHRISQKNVVTVVNFICKDTIEERIRGVLYGKNKITSQVLGDETEDAILQRLGPQDIAKLL